MRLEIGSMIFTQIFQSKLSSHYTHPEQTLEGTVMRYWWVNQKQTGHHEIPGGYIWAPIPTSNIVHHENVKHVQEGDIIFSYIRGEIVAIGVAQSNAYDANKPSEFSPSTPWRTEGRRVDVDFDQLTNPINIKEMTDVAMNSPKVNSFILKKTSEFYKKLS